MKISYVIKFSSHNKCKCVEKIMRNSSPTNLQYKPHGLMTENIVYPMIRQEISAAYYDVKC